MYELLQALRSRLYPLAEEMDSFVKGLDVSSLGTFYDADWGGIPTQAVFDKICDKVHGERPKSHYITYAHTSKAVSFARKHQFKEVCFFDYEPHEEISEITKNAEKVGVFGHHKGRDDIADLSGEKRFPYFNPRNFLPSEVTYETSSGKLESYRRGVPILFPFLMVARKNDIYASLITVLGLRGYGFKRLYEELSSYHSLNFPERKLDELIETVTLLVSRRLDNSSKIIDALYRADSLDHPAIREIRRISADKRLAESKNLTIGRTIRSSKVIGDVQIFPIQTDFQLIKPFVASLDSERKYAGKKTTVCVQKINSSKRKVSIRTDRHVDVAELLRTAHEQQTYKNYGGHETSGGFLTDHQALPFVLRDFLNSYFSQTNQGVRISADNLSFLLK